MSTEISIQLKKSLAVAVRRRGVGQWQGISQRPGYSVTRASLMPRWKSRCITDKDYSEASSFEEVSAGFHLDAERTGVVFGIDPPFTDQPLRYETDLP